jgi:transcriptional regulator with XRE-family HTH domain
MANFGRNVRALRRALNMTQSDLARHLPIHYVEISRIENGIRKTIPRDLHVQIATMLGVPPSRLTDETLCGTCHSLPAPFMTCRVCGTEGR